jgi:hypothetical protein
MHKRPVTMFLQGDGNQTRRYSIAMRLGQDVRALQVAYNRITS